MLSANVPILWNTALISWKWLFRTSICCQWILILFNKTTDKMIRTNVVAMIYVPNVWLFEWSITCFDPLKTFSFAFMGFGRKWYR